MQSTKVPRSMEVNPKIQPRDLRSLHALTAREDEKEYLSAESGAFSPAKYRQNYRCRALPRSVGWMRLRKRYPDIHGLEARKPAPKDGRL
jgi:hypothetical protein